MSGIDYEELIRSPLDDLDSDAESSGWTYVVAGLALGVGISLLLASLLGDDTVSADVPVVVETTAAEPVVELVSPVYPEGYTELVPGIGATVGEIVRTDENVVVTFLLAVARGEDVLARTWPIGGTWSLESLSGTVVQSTRVVLSRFSPAVFAVEFPAAAFGEERMFSSVSAVELWDQVTASGTVELPYADTPWVAAPVSEPISTETTLILAKVELGRYLGLVEWQLQGPEPGGIVDVVARLSDGDGVEIGTYAADFNPIVPAANGSVDLRWQQQFSVDQREAATVVLDYTVSTVAKTAVDVNFDLSAVSSG